MHRQTHRRTDRQTHTRTDRLTYRRTNMQTKTQDRRTEGLISIQTHDGSDKHKHTEKYTKEQTYRQTHRRTNTKMNTHANTQKNRNIDKHTDVHINTHKDKQGKHNSGQALTVLVVVDYLTCHHLETTNNKATIQYVVHVPYPILNTQPRNICLLYNFKIQFSFAAYAPQYSCLY